MGQNRESVVGIDMEKSSSIPFCGEGGPRQGKKANRGGKKKGCERLAERERS